MLRNRQPVSLDIKNHEVYRPTALLAKLQGTTMTTTGAMKFSECKNLRAGFPRYPFLTLGPTMRFSATDGGLPHW